MSNIATEAVQCLICLNLICISYFALISCMGICAVYESDCRKLKNFLSWHWIVDLNRRPDSCNLITCINIYTGQAVWSDIYILFYLKNLLLLAVFCVKYLCIFRKCCSMSTSPRLLCASYWVYWLRLVIFEWNLSWPADHKYLVPDFQEQCCCCCWWW